MAPIASLSLWNPEDDLLLKNAVEAGASLEALVKGAVRFSRRFTIQELQDRWHSLLYDPDISAEASARMVEFELSASNLLPKFNRPGNSKESAELPAKRNVESVRKQYYAMRKRICGEPFNSPNIRCLGALNINGCIGNGDGCQGHSTFDNEPPVGSCILGDHISNHFGLRETDVDIMHHALPQVRRDVAAANALGGTTNAFPTGPPNSHEDDHSDGVGRKDCFYGFREDISSLSVKELEKKDDGHSLKPNNECKIISHTSGDNIVDSGNHSGVEEMGRLRALPNADLFKQPDNLEVKSFSTFDSMDNDLGNVCSGFGGSQHFNSHVSDAGTSFHSMGFSSPLPKVPLWRMTKDISAPAMPINVSLGNEGQGAQEMPRLHDDNDCLLNFANEDDLLFMDVDANDTMDKSCYDNLNSLLLNSPNNSHEDDAPSISEPKTLVSDTCLAILGGECHSGLDVIDDPLKTGHGVQYSVCNSEFKVPLSTSVPNPRSPEPHGGVMCCTLNSEDPEIPSNEDIFSPAAFASSVILPISKEACDLATSNSQKDGDREPCLVKKEENPAQYFTGSEMVAPDTLPGTSLNHPLFGCGVKLELPDGHCLVGASRHANNAHVEPSQYRSANTAPNSVIRAKLEELDAPATFGEHQPLHAKPDSTKVPYLEPIVNPSTSDQEEFESDDDIAYFSDIEAMILEMDLCPYDQDSYISKEVSRNQYEDTKRTIVRLEQCARSSLHRAIASQGALAILYGRHMKHYIKKAEVILGRATEDIDVDIDLGREGRANKISRRQASIKMERDGSFFLKNLGKSSISVNGKEVATGQLLSLIPSCLIEIRELRFVFEVNHKSVRQYLANVVKKSQEKKTNFEWSPAGIP